MTLHVTNILDIKHKSFPIRGSQSQEEKERATSINTHLFATMLHAGTHGICYEMCGEETRTLYA